MEYDPVVIYPDIWFPFEFLKKGIKSAGMTMIREVADQLSLEIITI